MSQDSAIGDVLTLDGLGNGSAGSTRDRGAGLIGPRVPVDLLYDDTLEI